MIIQGIVRLPFSDLSGAYQRISTKFAVFLVNEHAADAKIKTTHCHFLVDLSGSFANLDSARKWLKSLSPLMKKPHYELHTETQDKPHVPYDKLLLARYIMKGDMPIMHNGFSQIELINLMAEWVDHTIQADEPSPAVLATAPKTPKLTQWQLVMEMCDEEDERFGPAEEGSTSMYRTYWTKRKDQHIPPQWVRDIVIRVCKRHQVFFHSEQVRKFIGAIFNMVDTDVNYNDYEEACIRGFNYKFSE